MPEVYIDQLELENFGPFYGNHLFNFGSLEGRCATLIGGKNGAGKTHLLRALYLAAVGEAGRGDLKRLETESEATKFSLDQSLNRRARREGRDTTKLAITLTLKEGHTTSRRLILTREIRHRTNSATEFRSSARYADEDRVEEEPERIQKIRDGFLPRHLARFFFFDAERSQNLQLSQEDIIQGISKVLGLFNYEELEGDLNYLISQKIPAQFGRGSEIEQKLADITAVIESCERKCKALIEERQDLEIQTSTADSELAANEEELQNLGAVDPKQLEEAREKYNLAKVAKTQLESTVRSAWEMSLPIGLLGKFREQLSADLIREERLRDWNNRKSSVEPKIPQIKADVFNDVPAEQRLNEELRGYYLNRLEDALLRLFNPPPEGMADKVYLTDRTEVSAQVRLVLRTPAKQILQLAETCLELDRASVQARELEQRLRQFQQNRESTDRANELREDRGRLRARREATERRLRDIESELAGFEAQKSEAQREQSNLGEGVAKLQRGRSLTVVANHYREAVSKIRQQAAIQMRERIAEHVGKLWVEIADRTLEYRGMEFDKHWQCFLIKHNGEQVPWDSVNTSAGQRQVRSLGFVEALRRLAKLAPPLVVDTPLGRLDKEVRQKVLENLYVSGHQCIILSTDSEIDPEGPLFRRIAPKIARVYTLHPQGRKESEDYEVRVTDDYFGHSL